jgi:hypothetical protein
MKSIVLFAAVLRIIIITALIGFTIFANAQSVAVNTTGNPADESAMLDIASTSKGFLPPRMTTGQRTGIPSPANGLMVYDTDSKSYWYFSDAWKEITNGGGGGSFTLPYSGSYSNPYKIFSIGNPNATNGSSAIYGKSGSNFSGWLIDYTAGVWGDNTNSNGYGVLGTSQTGTGIAGVTSQGNGVFGTTSGSNGFAGVYGTSNNSNGVGVMGKIQDGGIAVWGENTSNQGSAGKFFISNESNNANTADIYTFGSGRAIMAQVLNSNSGAEAATINTNGLGGALGAYILNAANNADAASFITNGLGRALQAKISNVNSTSSALHGINSGKGIAVSGENNGSLGSAGKFFISNANNNSNTADIYTFGMGRALMAQVLNSNSGAEAATINTNGLGSALGAYILHAGNSSNAANIITNGLGSALYVKNNNTNTMQPAIYAESASTGIGEVLRAKSNATTSSAIVAFGKGDSYSFAAIKGINEGGGPGLFGASTHPTFGYGVVGNASAGIAGYFLKDGNSSTGYALAVTDQSLGTGATIKMVNDANTSPALEIEQQGTGSGLIISNTNSNAASSLATFKKNGFNRARIDGAGKGFFNGGTQNSGADLAEAFDVTGNRNDYEPGDVLVISTDKDRTVEKSSSSYSTLVAGVFATKPGVLLTEEDIETDISDKVPMGVVGVIPTKVCLEGGEIKRGDLLVTSSIPGVAMKAAIETVKPGQVIGKALENFNSLSTGKIKVLVNAK